MAQEENKNPSDPIDWIKVEGVGKPILDIPVPENMKWEDTEIGKIVNDNLDSQKEVTLLLEHGGKLVLYHSKDDHRTPIAIETTYSNHGLEVIAYLNKENIEQVKAFFNSIP